MANILPTDLYPGYEYVASGGTVAADSVVIPLTDLPAITAAEADAATGDGRELIHAIIDAGEATLNALADNAKPVKMAMTRNTIQGLNATEYRKSFTCTFDTTDTSTSGNLSAEP